MAVARTSTEIEADIAETLTAKRALINGTRPQSLKHGDREIRFDSPGSDPLKAINGELARLQAELARVTGARPSQRPVGV